MQHVNKFGRNPVVNPATFPEEHDLGKWLAVQRSALKRGKLDLVREAMLNEAAPEWRQPGQKSSHPTHSGSEKDHSGTP